jgi:pSer/pThr/pTyr-binding forkhead associated (FHA) protein
LRRGRRTFDIVDGFVMGRAADCAVRLAGGLVSRHHARFRFVAGGVVVEDLGSRNGVIVNDKKIKGPTAIAHGDVLRIGLDAFDVIDVQVLSHPEHMSTLPPPESERNPLIGIAPPGQADVDDQDDSTIVAKLDSLSEREQKVLELIALGHTHREIAKRLFVSAKTIDAHRANLAAKLACHTRAELVAYAISAGLLGGTTSAKRTAR